MTTDETVKEIRKQLGAVEILRQSTEGLSFLHGFGYIHRNLEPANFWVARYEHCKEIIYQIKISDFRYSKDINVKPENSGSRTEKWFAPECAETKNTLKSSVDVFVLGMYYFYVVFGGHHPFMKRGDPNNSWAICINIQNQNHQVHTWAVTGGDNLTSGLPWDHEVLTISHANLWQFTAGYEPNDVSQFVNQALCLIKKMMRYLPSERLTLSQVTEDNFFKPKSDKCYEIYAPGRKPGLCLIFCNSRFRNSVRIIESPSFKFYVITHYTQEFVL